MTSVGPCTLEQFIPKDDNRDSEVSLQYVSEQLTAAIC